MFSLVVTWPLEGSTFSSSDSLGVALIKFGFGPTKLKIIGSTTSPWKRPKTTTRKKILKNVAKT